MMGCKNKAVTGSSEQLEARGAIKTTTRSRSYTEGSEDVGNNEGMAADRKVQKRKNVMRQRKEEMTDEKEESSTWQSRAALWGGRRCWEIRGR